MRVLTKPDHVSNEQTKRARRTRSSPCHIALLGKVREQSRDRWNYLQSPATTFTDSTCTIGGRRTFDFADASSAAGGGLGSRTGPVTSTFLLTLFAISDGVESISTYRFAEPPSALFRMYAVAPSVVLASATQPVRVALGASFGASSFGGGDAGGCCCAKTLTVPASADATSVEVRYRSIITPLSLGGRRKHRACTPAAGRAARFLPGHESPGFPPRAAEEMRLASQ